MGGTNWRSHEDNIKEDLGVLRASTWIKKQTRLIGLKYDTNTGVVYEVEDWLGEVETATSST